MATDREEAGLSTSLNMSVVGLLMFGAYDSATKASYRNAFGEAFAKEKCISSWEKVGAAPVTRSCLLMNNVRHDGGLDDGEDPMAAVFQVIQAQNDFCVHALNGKGYNGYRLQAQIRKDTAIKPQLTVANSKEHIEALSTAATHGERFFITGGCHLNSDDVFKATEVGYRRREHKELSRKKKESKEWEAREKEAFDVIRFEKPIEQLIMKELEKLLYWYRIPKTKMGNQESRRQKWREIKAQNKAPPQYKKWTDEDEARLLRLS